MTTLVLPAPDAPAEEWGRLAMRIPGWRAPVEYLSGSYMPCLTLFVPDPDHWMWEGWFLRLLGDRLESLTRLDDGYRVMWFTDQGRICSTLGCVSVGRAYIVAAAALDRWPGGGE